MKLIIESYNYKKYIDAFLNSLNTPEIISESKLSLKIKEK